MSIDYLKGNIRGQTTFYLPFFFKKQITNDSLSVSLESNNRKVTRKLGPGYFMP